MAVRDGAVAQLGERLVRNEEVRGSIPLGSTIPPSTDMPPRSPNQSTTAPRRDPTREAALALLRAVLDRRSSLDAALDSLPDMPRRDRAAAHRIAAAVLRHLGSLDAVMEPHLRRAPPQLVRHVLRIGAAQLLHLETPPHAAVGTAVALARSNGLAPFAGLINAVLRRVAEAGPGTLAELDLPRLDTPAWLWASWGSDARAIATAHQQEAPLDLTIRPGASAPPGGVMLPSGSMRFPPGTDPETLAGFAEGAFWVQDAAAALPARLLGDVAGLRVLDLCAAPGGKTAQLAAAGAHVTAVDRDPARLERLRQNLDRLHLNAETVCAAAEDYRPIAPFDAVLLDAPCTATGTIRRHPEILHLRRQRDVIAAAAKQAALLDAAAALLKPGGRLVYAVCSLQPQEHLTVLASAKAGLLLERLSPSALPGLEDMVSQDGTLHTHPGLWPSLGGIDGFFAARLQNPS